MTNSNRSTARELYLEAMACGEPLGWFEELYKMAESGKAVIPWADLEPNPNLVRWHKNSEHRFNGQLCLIVGCGFGDDSEYLQANGGNVIGFDIAPSAINKCKQRFPRTSVAYAVQDLMDPPKRWCAGFDFVFESYTLQVLPPDLRASAIAAISSFVAPDGALLVICRGRDSTDPEGEMPWPLTKPELRSFCEHGLSLLTMDDYMDSENPPVRRFVASFKRA